MAFQSVPETVQGTVKVALTVSTVAVMTFYFKRTGGYSPSQIDTLATTLDGWGGIQLRATLSNQISYVGVEVRGLENENDYIAVADAGAGIGGVNSPVLPPNVAFAVKRVSGFTGRTARGRVYWTGIPEAWVSGGAIGVAEADAVVAALDNMDTAVGLLGWTPSIVSRFSGGVKRALGITFPIIAWEYDNLTVDTQRRRLQQY